MLVCLFFTMQIYKKCITFFQKVTIGIAVNIGAYIGFDNPILLPTFLCSLNIKTLLLNIEFTKDDSNTCYFLTIS